MKRIMMTVLTLLCLAPAGISRANGWSAIFGGWPEHWVAIGGGYGENEAVRSQMLYSSATEYDILWAQQFGAEYNDLAPSTAEQAPLVNVDLFLTSKIWISGEYLFGDQNQSWQWTEPEARVGVPYSWNGETTFYTSPALSLNYAPFDIYGVKPYVGVGLEKVSATGDYTFITNGVSYPDPNNTPVISNGGWNLLYRAGVRFPIWNRFSGSVDWEGGTGASADTSLIYSEQNSPHNLETIRTSAINASRFSASLHLALF